MEDRQRWLVSILDSILQEPITRKTGIIPESLILRPPNDLTKEAVQAWLKEVRSETVSIESGIVGKITFKM